MAQILEVAVVDDFERLNGLHFLLPAAGSIGNGPQLTVPSDSEADEGSGV